MRTQRKANRGACERRAREREGENIQPTRLAVRRLFGEGSGSRGCSFLCGFSERMEFVFCVVVVGENKPRSAYNPTDTFFALHSACPYANTMMGPIHVGHSTTV